MVVVVVVDRILGFGVTVVWVGLDLLPQLIGKLEPKGQNMPPGHPKHPDFALSG